jgi:hypothetical protein
MSIIFKLIVHFHFAFFNFDGPAAWEVSLRFIPPDPDGFISSSGFSCGRPLLPFVGGGSGASTIPKSPISFSTKEIKILQRR